MRYWQLSTVSVIVVATILLVVLALFRHTERVIDLRDGASVIAIGWPAENRGESWVLSKPLNLTLILNDKCQHSFDADWIRVTQTNGFVDRITIRTQAESTSQVVVAIKQLIIDWQLTRRGSVTNALVELDTWSTDSTAPSIRSSFSARREKLCGNYDVTVEIRPSFDESQPWHRFVIIRVIRGTPSP
jgi:hypothetical protein